jgi:hypothetical protein
MWRRIIRILFILFVFLLVAAVIVQLILLTEIPRYWIIRTVGKELGIKVIADSLQTNLWGKTVIKNLVLTLPMEDGQFLSIPEINIQHSSVPMILLRGSPKIYSVKIVNPTISVRQDETHNWNIQTFASYLQQSKTNTKKQGNQRLPKLEIVNGTLSIVTRKGQAETIRAICFYGEQQGLMDWDFEMSIPSYGVVSGKVADGGLWAHKVKFDIKLSDSLIENKILGTHKPVIVNGELFGRIEEDQLIGTLKIAQIQFDKMQAYGMLGIEISPTISSVRFEDLLVQTSEFPVEKIKILSGSAYLDAKEFRLDNVITETGSILGSFTGCWNWSEKEGQFSSSWGEEIADRNLRYHGTLQGIVSSPILGRKQVSLSMATKGESSWGTWQNEATILGSGETWSTSRWEVSIPNLLLEQEQTDIACQDIKATIVVDWPKVSLIDLQAANVGHLKAKGEFSASDRSWTISVEAENIQSNQKQFSPTDLRLIANGNQKNISVKQFQITHQGLHFDAEGKMALPSVELSEAQTKVSWFIPPSTEGRELFANISGMLQCETDITGTIWPINLQLKSELSGKDINLNRKVISKIRIPWQAEIDTEQIKYNTDRFQLFDGNWDVKGEYEFSRRLVQVTLESAEVSLQPIVELFGLPLKSKGQMKTKLDAELPLSNIKDAALSGGWHVDGMVLGAVEADSAKGNVRIHDGTVKLDQIRLRQDQGLLSASAKFLLEQPQNVLVEVATEGWPIILPNNKIKVFVNGQGDGNINLSTRTAQGKGHISSSVVKDTKKLAYALGEISIEERTVALDSIKIEALGGSVSGKARIPLDNWVASSAELKWSNLELVNFADWWEVLEGLSGKSSGSLTAALADDGRPLEPLYIDINVDVSDGRFRTAQIGNCRLKASVGKERLLIEESEFDVMDGTLTAWGNLRWRGDKFSTYVHTDFSHLKLDQLLHLVLPDAKPTEGRLAGTGTLVILSDFNGMTGEINANLSESELGQVIVVRTIYDALNLKLGSRQPAGEGQIRLRLEDSTVTIPSFSYFNRGVEIRGAGSIDDLMMGGTSPVKGYAIGSIRPLKGTNLPGMDDLDRLMASLQTDVSSVQIQGTLAEPEVVPVPLREINDFLRILLWRQLRK